MSKWVESIPTMTNDYRVVNKVIVSNIFSRFGCPRAIISDGGSHLLTLISGVYLRNMEFTIASGPRITLKKMAK